MILTPRGEELIEPVRQILHNIRTQVVVAPEFDPQVTDRKIAIMASDYAIQVLLADAIAEFEKTAPNMKFDIQALNDSILDVFDRGAVDILITIDYSCSDNHPKTSLFTDDFVVLAYDQNEFVEGSTIDVETYLTLGHVVTKFGRSRLSSFEDWFMRRSSHWPECCGVGRWIRSGTIDAYWDQSHCNGSSKARAKGCAAIPTQDGRMPIRDTTGKYFGAMARVIGDRQGNQLGCY